MGDNEWLGYPDKVDGETRLLKVAVVSATHLASKGFFGGADPYIKIRLILNGKTQFSVKSNSVYWNQVMVAKKPYQMPRQKLKRKR